MARILLAWELGDGFGHVSRMLTIAEELRVRGHDCVFVVRNLEVVAARVQAAGFDVLPAPTQAIRYAPSNGHPPTSVGDILAFIGFAEIERLRPFIKIWTSLVSRLAPDVVILDYAPTARLAIGDACPTIVIGDGFTLPPAIDGQFPKFRSGDRLVDEAAILDVIDRVQSPVAGWKPHILPDLFEGTQNFVITLPQMDYYGDQRQTPAIGPITPLPKPAGDTPSTDFFAYLSTGYKHIQRACQTIASPQLSGSLFLRDSRPDGRETLRERGLTVHEAPQDMVAMAEKARVFIHHGGIGTCETVMALGRPQVIFPRHAEQRINAATLKRAGVAMTVPEGPDVEVAEMVRQVRAFIDDPRPHQKAREIATALAQQDHSSVAIVADACDRLVADAR